MFTYRFSFADSYLSQRKFSKMPKKSVVKTLLCNEKKILKAAQDCNFFSLQKTDNKQAYLVLFRKLDILKIMPNNKRFKEAQEMFKMFFWKQFQSKKKKKVE